MRARLRQAHTPRALKRSIIGGAAAVRDAWQPLTGLVSELDTRGIRRVLDVGANVGQFATDLRSAGYRGAITSFEPAPAAFGHLQRRAAADELWTAVNVAVALDAGPARLRISANEGLSSTLSRPTVVAAQATPGARIVGEAIVRTITWNEVFPDRGAAHCFVKIDCQGLDVALVRDLLDRGHLPAGLQFEVGLSPMYEQAGSLHEALAAVEELGLVVHDLRPGIRDRRRRLLEVDVVAFVPQPEHPAT